MVTYRLYIAYVFLLFSSLSVIGMYEEEKEHDDAGWQLLVRYHEALVDRDDAIDAYTPIIKEYTHIRETKNYYRSLYGRRLIKNITGVAKEHNHQLKNYTHMLSANLTVKNQQNKAAKNTLIKKYNKWLKLYIKLNKSDQHIPLQDCLGAYCIINNIITKQIGFLHPKYSEYDVYKLCNAIKNGGFDSCKDNSEFSNLIKEAKIVVPAISKAIAHRNNFRNDIITGNNKWNLSQFNFYLDEVKMFVDGDTGTIGIDSLMQFYDMIDDQRYSIDVNEFLQKVKQIKRWKKGYKNKCNLASNRSTNFNSQVECNNKSEKLDKRLKQDHKIFYGRLQIAVVGIGILCIPVFIPKKIFLGALLSGL